MLLINLQYLCNPYWSMKQLMHMISHNKIIPLIMKTNDVEGKVENLIQASCWRNHHDTSLLFWLLQHDLKIYYEEWGDPVEMIFLLNLKWKRKLVNNSTSCLNSPICINNFLKCICEAIGSKICWRWFHSFHNMKYYSHLWIAIKCCTL